MKHSPLFDEQNRRRRSTPKVSDVPEETVDAAKKASSPDELLGVLEGLSKETVRSIGTMLLLSDPRHIDRVITMALLTGNKRLLRYAYRRVLDYEYYSDDLKREAEQWLADNPN